VRRAGVGVKLGGMNQPESDVEMVGRIYREQMAATKQHSLAYHACLAAWRERHSDVSEQAAKEMVASLISAAIEAGFVWPDIQWWEK